MSLGVIARCDPGGLGTLTAEVWRNLRPDRTLLLDLGDRGRGECGASAYDIFGTTYQQVYPAEFAGGLSERAIDWLCAEGIDTLWSAETFYDREVLLGAHRNSIRTVCYAMPELAPWADDPRLQPRPRELYVPTEWRASTVPNAEILPMPVARDRLPFRERTEVAHLFHMTGAAFHDRNGTDLLCRALPFIESRVRLTIRAERPVGVPRCRCDVDIVNAPVTNYWDAIPKDVDLLVLPRRYGGLSLPCQEAASLGIPSLMLESDPYSPFGFVHPIPTTRSRNVSMKGCRRPGVPVFDADPRVLAAKIDWLVANPDRQQAASHAADAWAEAHAWHGSLGDRWCSALSANCAERQEAA